MLCFITLFSKFQDYNLYIYLNGSCLFPRVQGQKERRHFLISSSCAFESHLRHDADADANADDDNDDEDDVDNDNNDNDNDAQK